MKQSIPTDNKCLITSIQINPQHNFHVKKYLPSFHQQNYIISNIITDLLMRIQQIIQEKQILSLKLTKYSKQKALIFNDQIIKITNMNGKVIQNIIQDNQPHPLRTDNFISITENQKKYSQSKDNKYSQSKDKYSDKLSRTTSLKSINLKNSKITTQKINTAKQNKQTKTINNLKPVQYIKLKQSQQQKQQKQIQINDPFVQQMRRQKSLTSNILQLKSNNNKVTKIRQIISNDTKNNQINFDYSGNIIKIIDYQKANFINKCIDGLPDININKLKQAKIDKNPTNLNNQTKKQNSMKKALSKRAVQIQFSSISSLNTQMKPNLGVKFVYNKQILQNRKKQVSVNDIRKNIIKQRLSKQNFERLRSFQKSKSSISISMIKNTQILPAILKSQSDIDSRVQNFKSMSINNDTISKQKTLINSKISLAKQKILVENQQLLEILLEKNNLYSNNINLQSSNCQKLNQTETIALSRIDQENLNYIKTKSVGSLELPKINNKNNLNIKVNG